MIQKLIITILLLNIISCKSQEKIKNPITKKENKMEYFDKVKFDDNKKNGEYRFTLSDNTEVRQMGPFDDSTYSEEGKKINLPYRYAKTFFSKSLSLKSEGITFLGLPIGIDKFYDENGNLVKEVNHDLPYKFSIDDLREKIKKEFDLDIVKDYNFKEPSAIKVSRSFYGKVPSYYQVAFEKMGKTIYLEIDGTTGNYKKKEVERDDVKPNDKNVNQGNK